MFSDTTSLDDLRGFPKYVDRVLLAVQVRLELCVESGFLTPTVCLDDDEWFWKPSPYSPDTPDALPIWPELFEWSPHALNNTSDQLAHYIEFPKKNARDMQD